MIITWYSYLFVWPNETRAFNDCPCRCYFLKEFSNCDNNGICVHMKNECKSTLSELIIFLWVLADHSYILLWILYYTLGFWILLIFESSDVAIPISIVASLIHNTTMNNRNVDKERHLNCHVDLLSITEAYIDLHSKAHCWWFYPTTVG